MHLEEAHRGRLGDAEVLARGPDRFSERFGVATRVPNFDDADLAVISYRCYVERPACCRGATGAELLEDAVVLLRCCVRLDDPANRHGPLLWSLGRSESRPLPTRRRAE